MIPDFTYAQQLTTFETADFSGSGVCAFCHSRLSDEAGNDVSNDAHWRSTMMANAAKDPLWQAKISAEVALPHMISRRSSRKNAAAVTWEWPATSKRPTKARQITSMF